MKEHSDSNTVSVNMSDQIDGAGVKPARETDENWRLKINAATALLMRSAIQHHAWQESIEKTLFFMPDRP